MTRLVIHAGFHKTGTTSVQTLISGNRRLFKRHARCFLKADFEDLTQAARRFSITPDAMTLADVTAEACRFFETVDTDDPRPVLLCSEDLSGHMPGRHGLDGYDAAPILMTQLAAAARDRFGPTCDLVFFFSTRSGPDWLQSTWWQNLRSTRLTLDYPDYAEKYRAAANHSALLQDLAEAVAPAQVAAMSLEESTTLPHGPLTPLLDLLDIPDEARRKIKMQPPANVQPDLGLQRVMLALNQSRLPDKSVKDLKLLVRKHGDKAARDP